MKCLLHIGTEKTGSTILQNWLYKNIEVLSGFGIYLSESLGKANNRLVPVYFQRHLDNWAKLNGIFNENDKKNILKDLLKI